MPSASDYESHMAMHISTVNTDISLAREFRKHCSDPTQANGFLDHGKDRKIPINRSGLRVSIMSKTENMCHIYQL